MELRVVLQLLETKHGIKFSYETNEVSAVKVSAPNDNATLAESLLFLKNSTPFNFVKIDERYYTVIREAPENAYCGKLIDLVSKDPLVGANVIGLNSEMVTITNAEGFFYLPSSWKLETIVISFIGYESKEVNILDLSTSCPTIEIAPEVASLDPVLIGSIFTRGISKQLNGSIKVKTKNFGLLPGQVDNDVLQIIQVLPGVESVDETISNINIRGGTHAENGIFWDDIKMYQSGHFFGLISAFNPDLTTEVSVYKNGSHPRFGEGVSGVIDMKSKNDIPNSISGGVGFNLINVNGFAEIPINEKLGIQISARRSINNVFQSPLYTIYADRIFQDSEITNIDDSNADLDVTSEEDFRFFDLGAKVLWDLSSKDELRLNFLAFDNSLEFTETLNMPASSKTSRLEQENLAGGLSWKRHWNSKFETMLLAYGSSYLLNALNEDIFTTQEQMQENNVLETGVRLDAMLSLSEKIGIQGGYQFSETGISNTQDISLPRFRSFRKDVLRTHAVFANIEYISEENTTIVNLGARANYFSKFSKILVEPRLGIHQKLGAGFALEAMGEFKSQSTSQRVEFDSDFLGVEKRRWVLSTEDGFPLIKSKQASFGAVYNKYNWLVNVEGFYKFVDGISTSNQGLQNQFRFANSIGSYSVQGFEATINKKTKRLSTWLSYIYMNNNYTFEDLTPPEFPNNLDIRHSVTLANTYSLNQFKLALGLNWRTGKPNTIPLIGEEIALEDSQQVINFDSPNNARLPEYFRIDISAEYLWNISTTLDAKFNLAILNMFNNKNIINRRYSIDNDENGDTRVNQVDEISLGFTPNFSFQLLF